MPAYRRKINCAYAEPTPKKPRQQLSEEEKEDAKLKRDINKLIREQRTEWEATLTPWKGDEAMRWPVNTLALFKSDAKKAFSLTEAELLTLPHECIAASPKSYFALKDVQALAHRKHEAGALLEDPSSDPDVLEGAGVRKKRQDNGRRNKGNWADVSSWQVPGSRMFLAMQRMKATKEKDENEAKVADTTALNPHADSNSQ
ncbi:hypothetical protein FIBSPDRAFT_850485 [Athelia psychrophila]|uniref:Uncharacterized protein n=1 Tax=Athelia psychrophila TaxID=1759441 RepID=A0A166TGL2_9AGAM|nr:hypothetical protein FIBSPDRAFT_850485 [Fibularhizoctonia sp. CBS 109695]